MSKSHFIDFFRQIVINRYASISGSLKIVPARPCDDSFIRHKTRLMEGLHRIVRLASDRKEIKVY